MKKIESEKLKNLVVKILDDFKVEDIVAFNVCDITSITDFMVIGTGRSPRHLQGSIDRLTEALRPKGYRPLRTVGENGMGWALVDLGDVVAHIMLPETRELYALEKLWGDRRA